MFSCEASSGADPAEAWALIARPERWHEWAPHVRGAWGLGDPEVQEGRKGYARLLGVVPVPATVTEVVAGRSWTWRVGPTLMVHRVESEPDGCRVAVDIKAPGPLEPVLRAFYGPLVERLLARLAARAANRDSASG